MSTLPHPADRCSSRSTPRPAWRILPRAAWGHSAWARSLCALSLGAALLGLPAAGQAAPLDVHGVQVADSASVAGTSLPRQGVGTRYKVIFKVYVAALYSGQKADGLQALVQQPGPKRLAVSMLRDVDAGELGKLLTRGIEDNVPSAKIPRLVPALARMGQLFAEQKQLKSGDTFLIDWVPGQGTLISVRGQVQGEPFKEPEFFAALMAIWLGEHPADAGLKAALLGGPPN